MITLVQLEYVVAVDTFRHFARAAEHCNVTQPTLSMQIKKLEDDLHIRIFDRQKQPVMPTDHGREFIEQARQVLAEAGRLSEMVEAFKGKLGGQLRLGIIPTLGPYLLPLFAGNFKKLYPTIQLFVEEMVTEELAARLKNDQLDAAIFVTPYGDKGIIEEPLFYEEMLVYAHESHPLLQQESIRPTDMAMPDIWLLSDGHCFRNQVINLCALPPGSRKELPFQLEGGTLETLMRIIRREGGYTLIPELAAADASSWQPGNIKHFSCTKPLREVSLCFSRYYVKERLLRVLANEIRQSVPAHMLDKNRGEVVSWK
ncbi:MAG TPA: LysR substrate-binding domain-containing protein [Bacteroidales bacterium]|nr:LysR substrate-binding domain-containing protein [Bacteroidales bacterium]